MKNILGIFYIDRIYCGIWVTVAVEVEDEVDVVDEEVFVLRYSSRFRKFLRWVLKHPICWERDWRGHWSLYIRGRMRDV